MYSAKQQQEEVAATTSPSQDQRQATVENFKYSKRVVLKSIIGRDDRGLGLVGQRVVVGGWVKSKREKKETGHVGNEEAVHVVTCCQVIFLRIPLLRSLARAAGRRDGASTAGKDEAPMPHVAYLMINDGSCVENLQVVVDSSMSLVGQVMSRGASILVEGVLEQPLAHGNHLELKAEKIMHVGAVDIKKYPLAKARLSMEFLRSYPHLRPRTTAVASIARIRNTLSYATHAFFHNNGFIHVHMPVITSADVGDSSKMFKVTALLSRSDYSDKLSAEKDRDGISLDVVKASIREKSSKVEELKRSNSNREALAAALQDLQKANELALQMEEKQMATASDSSADFFPRPAYLSASSVLCLESYACALSSVYTFGPIFQAERSRSAKQLAEMWVVEVELAFAGLEDAMNCAEDFLKSVLRSVLHDCSDDMTLISKRLDKNCIHRLQSTCSNPLARITYTEALDVLKKAADRTFEANVEWGINLSEEHESYLADEVYKQPVIIYEYPKEIKPFYVHVNDDGRTASAFDIIAPKVGVLIRGSQKEEHIDKIITRMEELGLHREQYEWYLDIRRDGTVKHSGFSVGFENVVMFAAGLDDIKDAVPFPRYYGSEIA